MIKKTIAAILVLVLIFSSAVNVSAAAAPFTTVEIFGEAGKTFLVSKEDAPLRAEPVNTGSVYEKLPKGFPVQSDGLFRTRKGTLWIKAYHPEYGECWIFRGNLEQNAHICEFLTLENNSYPFEFCSGCGHVRPTDLNFTSIDTSMESADVHLVLSVLSLAPVVGNAFDVIDALYAFYDGDFEGGLLSLTCAIPLLGEITGVSKMTDSTVYAIDYLNTLVRARKSGRFVEVFVEPSSKLLARSMDGRYNITNDDRFYNYSDYYLPGRSIAAHHIVPGSAPDAFEARQILFKTGIDLNGWENGVYLCMKTDICSPESTIHAGGHSLSYYRTVNERVVQAYNAAGKSVEAQRAAVVEELSEIASDLMSGDLKL